MYQKGMCVFVCVCQKGMCVFVYVYQKGMCVFVCVLVGAGMQGCVHVCVYWEMEVCKGACMYVCVGRWRHVRVCACMCVLGGVGMYVMVRTIS